MLVTNVAAPTVAPRIARTELAVFFVNAGKLFPAPGETRPMWWGMLRNCGLRNALVENEFDQVSAIFGMVGGWAVDMRHCSSSMSLGASNPEHLLVQEQVKFARRCLHDCNDIGHRCMLERACLALAHEAQRIKVTKCLLHGKGGTISNCWRLCGTNRKHPTTYFVVGNEEVWGKNMQSLMLCDHFGGVLSNERAQA